MLDVMDEARVRAGEAHAAWSERFNEMFAGVAGEFENAGSRKRARAYVLGLLSHAERKNGWTLAEFAGDSVAGRDAAAVERLRRRRSPLCGTRCHSYVVRNLGDPAAVLAVDKTGFLKKGRMSTGVARQYTGTAGRMENSQVGGLHGLCHAGRVAGADRPGAVPAGEMGRGPGPVPGGRDRR